MTTLTITPDVAKKRMKIDGVIAAGEKVAVTVKGFGDKSVIDTRLRVYCGRELIAIYPKDPEEGQQQIPWSVSGDDLTCELDLFTLQAEKATRCGCAECLFILDDYMAGQLYATREKEILKWIKRGGSDIPYNLSGYRDILREFGERLDEFESDLDQLKLQVDDFKGKFDFSTISELTDADSTRAVKNAFNNLLQKLKAVNP